jgi:hypothetical protein
VADSHVEEPDTGPLLYFRQRYHSLLGRA